MSEIVHLSEGKVVSMADSWFDIATLEHFWVRRRFEVFRQLLGGDGQLFQPVAEVGCGHGLVQAQFKKVYGVQVDGFELNEYALSRSVASDQPRFVYDIHDRRNELKEKYGLIILFDVIEHLEDDSSFVESVLFHLKPGGILAVNVPALEFLRSRYDDEQGHFRRYTLGQLEELGRRCGLIRLAGTYWCMPLVPVLLMRKLLLKFKDCEKAVVQSGFVPPSRMANALLYGLSLLEFLPHRLTGTSAMCIYRKEP
jgi:SAM-dependent methyltransferase